MYQIGLVSVSFRGLSPEEIIRIAKDAGLNRIEWGSDVHAPFDDAERLSTIAACQRSAGAAVPLLRNIFRARAR